MIFAAGLGTRLRPFTDSMPKALLPLNGHTLLEWQIQKLKNAGITDIVVNVHHFADKIIEYLQENHNFGCNILISDERDRLLDTGGGLLKAKQLLLDGDNNSPILACNVDILSNINIARLCEAHRSDSLATLVVSERKTQRYLLFNSENRMIGWTNIATGEMRPASLAEDISKMHNLADSDLQKLAFSGMQILSQDIFEHADTVLKEKGDKFSLIDLYLSVCRSHIVRAYVPTNYCMLDVGKTDQLAQAELFVRALSSAGLRG